MWASGVLANNFEAKLKQKAVWDNPHISLPIALYCTAILLNLIDGDTLFAKNNFADTSTFTRTQIGSSILLLREELSFFFIFIV